jgi:hypothetical protein
LHYQSILSNKQRDAVLSSCIYSSLQGYSKKWATFTYHNPNVRKITNLFKQTDIKIAFKSTNTTQQQTRPTNHETTPDHNKSGVYKLLCKTCNKTYVGQTSRNLSRRFHEHMTYIKNNDPKSAYAQHILQNIHEYGTLTDTMTLLKPIYNPTKLIPYEQLFIQTFHPQRLPHRWTIRQWSKPAIPVSHRYKPDVTGPSQTDQYLRHEPLKPGLSWPWHSEIDYRPWTSFNGFKSHRQ